MTAMILVVSLGSSLASTATGLIGTWLILALIRGGISADVLSMYVLFVCTVLVMEPSDLVSI